VKENKEQIAGSLVTRTVGGDMHCAAMMVSLMEKKKDGEDDDDWDGPGLADILVPSSCGEGRPRQSRRRMAKRRRRRRREKAAFSF